MVFAGTTAITNDQAGAIYMCDTIGNRIWSHSFDASGTTEHFIDVTEMDKRIYAVGHTSYGSGNYGSFLVKFDLKGNTLWQKYIDFANYDAAMYIQETHQHSLLTAHWVSYNGSSDMVKSIRYRRERRSEWFAKNRKLLLCLRHHN